MSNIDNQPLRYWNGNAVYLSLYLSVVLVGSILLTFLLEAARFPTLLLGFLPGTFLRGALWQPFTYIFVNQLSFFALFLPFCFYQWGVEVEKYLGRRSFLMLCGTLVLLPVAVSLVFQAFGHAQFLSSAFLLVVGLLIAFATLYPDMDYIGGWVPLKWFAFACISFQSILYFPEHDWAGLIVFWANCGAAFVMVRSGRGLLDFHFRMPGWLQRKPKLRVLPRPDTRSAPARQRKTAPVTGSEAEVDALLDKIARSGLQSLTEAERVRLEKARLEMLKKEH